MWRPGWRRKRLPAGSWSRATVHDAVAGRLKATFDDLGSLALKNIERPVQAFRVKWEPRIGKCRS